MAGTSVDEAGPADEFPRWRTTMWTMVMVQLVMSTSFSFLSPIMPLFLPQIGVHTISGVDLWAGILASTTSFIGAFASPLWGRMSDRYGRKLMVLRSSFAISVCTILMGTVGSVWQLFGVAHADGDVRRVSARLPRGDGGEPGAGAAIGLRAGHVEHRATPPAA